jgi:hypothetical protein
MGAYAELVLSFRELAFILRSPSVKMAASRTPGRSLASRSATVLLPVLVAVDGRVRRSVWRGTPISGTIWGPSDATNYENGGSQAAASFVVSLWARRPTALYLFVTAASGAGESWFDPRRGNCRQLRASQPVRLARPISFSGGSPRLVPQIVGFSRPAELLPSSIRWSPATAGGSS